MTSRQKAPSLIRTAGRLLSSPGRRWWVGVAVVVALAVPFVAYANLTRMEQSFLDVDWNWLAVTLALLVVALVLRSVALKAITDALGSVRARFSDAFSATSVGLLANSVIPIRVGTVLAPYTLYMLLRRRGATVPFVTALGVALTERLLALAMFAALALAFVTALAMPGWVLPALVAIAVFAGILLVGTIALERHRRRRVAGGAGSGDSPAVPRAGESRWRVTPRVAQAPPQASAPPSGPRSHDLRGHSLRRHSLLRHVPALFDSQRIMGKPWALVFVAVIQVAGWLAQLAAAWAALQAFHLDGPGWQGAAQVLVLTNLIGLVPITPGNVGTFQAAAAAALAASGVGAGPAVAYAVGLQAVQLLVVAVAGLASLSLQGLTLGDLRGRSNKAASLLYAGDQPVPKPAEGPPVRL